MKKVNVYEDPQVTVIRLVEQDVITTSPITVTSGKQQEGEVIGV